MPQARLIGKRKTKIIFLSAISLGVFVALLFFGDNSLISARECILFCATSLAPSLFPLMCASAILTKSQASEFIGKMLYPLCKRLFGLSKNGAYVFAIGNLCGFPIGAQSAYEMYRDNKISKDELDCLIIISSTPSSAFVISAIGVSILKSRRLGICLYICAIISVFICGMSYRWVHKGAKEFPDLEVCQNKNVSLAAGLCDAIRSSAQNMLYICGFVVFFNILSSTVKLLCIRIGVTDILYIVSSGLLELSSGGIAAGELLFPKSLLLCAFFVGWSGLSVHFQIFSVCKDVKVSYVKFFVWRFIMGVICALCCSLAISFGFI